ncbi:EamA family transporter [Pontibacter sp. G13]|uniref:DMT family transporter n=1 Tax=Pontibacter sp. G13 TaxID=3074898 RepID=UPI00288B5011|nr:EamA family transporter [Pontibacter sp. G13]WNJ16153.1 EamA family transporter [Pontibacter sp. G13]
MTLSNNALGKAYAQLHIAILLFGFTAILGDLITLSGIPLVWYRMVITLISLCFFPGLIKRALALPRKTALRLLGIGVLMAIHWVTFFEAIKQSNVSITLSCIASTAFFTSLIEPLFFGRKIKIHEIGLGLLVIVGFGFIFSFVGDQHWLGIGLAILSAFVVAFAGVFNKAAVETHDVYVVSFMTFLAGVIFLTAVMPIYLYAFPEQPIIPTTSDIGYLLFLALGCTTLAYSLNMLALRHLSAYTVALSINLEPIYGMVMALMFLGEGAELNTGFYIGAGLILAAVFLHPIFERFQKSKAGSLA